MIVVILMTIHNRWMGVLGKRLKIVMVPVPTLSGPTSGTFRVVGVGD